MQKVKLTAWEIKVNDKGVEMAHVNREQLVQLLKYVEHLEGEKDNLLKDFHKENMRNRELEAFATKIKNWETPSTGEFWDDAGTKRPVSYETNYGSNGVRDYFKGLANELLTTK